MNHVLAILGMGTQELLLIVLAMLLLFGATKLPKLARAMGSSVNEFKKGMAEGVKDDDASKSPTEPAEKK